MKNLFFTAVTLIFLLSFSNAADAQRAKHAGKKRGDTYVAKPVKFIEGIEIKRDMQPKTEAVAPAIASKASGGNSVNSIEKCLRLQFKYAQILNRDVELITNLSLYGFIEDWWQVPYSYGGNSKSGIDCSGFVNTLFNTVYSTDIPRTARDEYNASEKIQRENLAEGDLVFFNTRGGVSHVGVYLGNGYFVHASTSNGVTINQLDDDYYSARFLGGGKIAHSADDGVAKTK